MLLVCPSCHSSFEASASLEAGPGAPLCEACSSSAEAPPPPPLRASRPDLDAFNTKRSISVFPSANPPSDDLGPVSLQDLDVVLAPPSTPPAWKGEAPPGPPPKAAKPAPERKPSFFRVSIPPPAEPELPAPEAPNSGLHDILGLAAAAAEKEKSADASLFSLSGGLFGDSPRAQHLAPPDLSLLAPPPSSKQKPQVTSEPPPPSVRDTRPSSRPIAPVVSVERMPRSERPPARASAAPVVAERRAASRRGGIASGVAGAAALGMVILAFVMHFGDKPSRADAQPPATATVDPPASTTTQAPPPVRVEPTPPPAVTVAETSKPHDVPAATVRPPPDRTAAPTVTAAPQTTTQSPERVVVAPPPAATTAPPATTTPPPPAAGSEFDRGAAKAALAAAAGAASGCKQPDDPSGGAKVSITFGPSGRVTSATIIGGTLQGTKTGACVAGAFRRASVPPFSGDPVSVTKEVAVQ